MEGGSHWRIDHCEIFVLLANLVLSVTYRDACITLARIRKRLTIEIFTSGDSTLVYKCSFPSSSPSAQRTIEHGSIETNELNMTLMSHMTHHELV